MASVEHHDVRDSMGALRDILNDWVDFQTLNDAFDKGLFNALLERSPLQLEFSDEKRKAASATRNSSIEIVSEAADPIGYRRVATNDGIILILLRSEISGSRRTWFRWGRAG
jgi:hypothetical protein